VNTKNSSTNYYGNSENSDVKIRHFGLHFPFSLEEKNQLHSISYILLTMQIFKHMYIFLIEKSLNPNKNPKCKLIQI